MLENVYKKERKSNAGRPPFDVVMMFKILVLQRLLNLSDDQTEYQITDRMSFQRFIGLSLGERVTNLVYNICRYTILKRKEACMG